MKLADLLNELNWTQTRLAQKAHISTSTVKRALTASTSDARVSRDHANAICAAISRGLERKITIRDIDEFHEHQLPLERETQKPQQPIIEPRQQMLVDGAKLPTKRKRKRRRRSQSQKPNIPKTE